MAKKGHLLPKSGINSELVSIQRVKAVKYEKREPNTRISYMIAALKAATIYSIQQLSTWLLFRVFNFILRDQPIAANSRERLNFEQQISALLFVHQTHDLSRIKWSLFATS